jgi:hypothetical protein
MGRRDRDERPPVELWSAPAEPAPEVQRVALAPPRRGGRRGAVVAAIVLGLLGLGALTSGGEDDPEAVTDVEQERDNSARNELKPEPATAKRTTTTTRPTTTTTIAPGAVLGAPVGADVVLAGTNTWTWLDLDTGERRDLLMGPAGDAFTAVAVRGGVVVSWLGRVEYIPVPDGEGRELLPGAISAVSSGDPDSVWLLSEPPAMERRRLVATLVDLTGEVLMGPIDVSSRWIGDATTDGVLFQRAGRTYVATEDGPQVVAVGDLFGSTADAAVVYTCDDEVRCGIELIDTTTGERTAVPVDADPYDNWFEVVPGPEPDRLAIVEQGDRGSVVAFVDGGVRQECDVPISSFRGEGQVRWLPGDLGVLVLGGPTGVIRCHVGADGLVQSEPVAAFDGRRGDVLFVIPR